MKCNWTIYNGIKYEIEQKSNMANKGCAYCVFINRNGNELPCLNCELTRGEYLKNPLITILSKL